MALMLIDGNSLTYRAFFALPTDMATAAGQVTNAVYGFTSMLVNLLRDHRPDGIAVAFDRPEPTFRHEAVPGYKANREAAPDILREQMGLVRQVVETLGIPVVEMPGYEADDVIATLATQGRDAGREVLVVTGDRDTFQLVEDPAIRVLYNKRGVSDYALYDEAGIEERTGVLPRDYVQYAALRGDPSDNLPGVPGVGEKTAAKLINAYGDIDGIYRHLDDQTPKLRENLRSHEEQVRSNAEMMLLERGLDLGLDSRELHLVEMDLDEVRKLFDFLEFHSLYDRLSEVLGAAPAPDSRANEAVVAEVVSPGSAREVVAVLEGLLGAEGGWLCVAASWGDARREVDLAGLAVVSDAGAGEVLWIQAGMLEESAVHQVVLALLAEGGRRLAMHDAKPLAKWLAGRGRSLGSLSLDTMLGAYLLSPGESGYPLADVLARYTMRELPSAESDEQGQLSLADPAAEDAQGASAAACAEALAVAFLVDPLSSALEVHGLSRLNDQVEVPLVGVLAKMEQIGVRVDVEELRALNERLRSEASELTGRIWDDAGEQFNVNSTPQLRKVLFQDLGLTPQKKTKTGYSTDATSLERLRGEHPIIGHLLRYREVEKLRSTYGEGLLAEVASDGRIHATFNQTVARTGRLSSDRPNLHNIPVRSEEGRAFRRAFVPSDGFEFLIADYNQIELRCIAHLAEDPGLIAAFESGTDIHRATAARVFGVDPEIVSPEQRSKAKMVSYGLAYGMEAYGLAQRLGIPTDEAEEILGAYFEAFPAVRDYMDRTVAEARERGYTETLFGRRRLIPELSSPNYRIRQAGERQAMNAGIQGLAADIFKVALVRLDRGLGQAGSSSRLVLQVHDEVILEVSPPERDRVTALTLEAMRGAFDLRVPLEVNLAFGLTWAEAKA